MPTETKTKDRPASLGWCDEHKRYFFWKTGCAKGTPVPTSAEVRAYYDFWRTK